IGFTGIGVIVAAQTVLAATAKRAALPAIPSAALLGVPLVLTYSLMFGLRVAFAIPAHLRGNWLFRLSVDPGIAEARALARRVMATFEFPILVLSAAVYARFWDGRIALVHTTVRRHGGLAR